MSNFADRLWAAVQEKDSQVCVGLDPHLDRLPAHLAQQSDTPARAVERFCCQIVEAVAPDCVAAKLQTAYFEVLRDEGWQVLWSVAACARRQGLLVIIDGKRNDIGSTAQAYAEAYLRGDGAADAITVNPYLGIDGVQPFIKAAQDTGRGLFVLVKTSNPSSGQLQDLPLQTESGEKLVYQHVADLVAEWSEPLIGECGYSSIGAVVGATYPEQLAELRGRLPHVPFLVPGYGAQGGTAEDIAPAFDGTGLGAIVNSSRGIIFAYQQSHLPSEGFAEAAARAAAQMKQEINAVLRTPRADTI